MADTNDPREVDVAIAALVFSVLALLGVVFQYFQAIIGRTNGRWIRDKAVMGKWADYAKLRLKSFSGEVEYEAPIIFLAATDNVRGPVEGKEIWYVDGTDESCNKTRVDPPPPDRTDATLTQRVHHRERVHTVKTELATWVLVISAAQKMERDSKNWEDRKWRAISALPNRNVPGTTPVSLAVAIQAMTRSFDKHPAVSRPYASTTICHIIELCAVLGIYWKEFDRVNDKYRAEGNGYSLLGMRVNDFGLVFTFEKPGWPRFEKNRVIPTSEVKELCFGNVPTLYRLREDDEYWKEPINEQAELKTLQLGSRTEIAETLNLIRCNELTTQCYSDPTKKHIHLFPVVFEVLGMLARPFHIMDRPFTYLPNPAAFPLNKQAFSPRRLLAEFQMRLHDEMSSAAYGHRNIEDALRRIDSLASDLTSESGLVKQVEGDFSPTFLNKLHEAIDEVDKFILKENTQDVVLDVLRRHIQEVLLAINTPAKDVEFDGNNSPTTVTSSHHGGGSSVEPSQQPAAGGGGGVNSPGLSTLITPSGGMIQQNDNISFDYLLKVPHEKRESALLDTYFREIRFRAVSLTTSQEYHDPQAAEASRVIHDALGLSSLRNNNNNNNNEPAFGTQQSTPSVGPSNMSRQTTGFTERFIKSRETWGTLGTVAASSGNGFNRLTHPNEVRRDTIWCALVFRMICWLLLHDFDKKDLQLAKSELMGSRLSVFIV
ncbi:Mod-A [Cladorrhinum sp. PSN332]|nr:Mod-A [Cladorrhinum sp. PSN332]